MRVTVRKGPPLEAGGEVRVVAELWMSSEEAGLFPIGLADIADTLQECLKEHTSNGRHRATRTVRP